MRAPQSAIPLWPQGAPGALGNRPHDIPSITPYFADSPGAGGTAVIICPGGTYHELMPHEGEAYARWMNELGVTAFVLQYRLGSNGYRHPAMFLDVSRAMRLVRARAAGWNIDAGRIGIIGSSAGGHLASTLLTHFDSGNSNADDPVERQSSRPDFGVLCYAVLAMNAHTHEGLRRNLLGENPAPAEMEFLSSEKHVRSDMPPCFLWHTGEDAVVPQKNSLDFATALAAKGVPFDLHVYEKGRHGIGLGQGSATVDKRHPWTDDLQYWLNERGLLAA